MSNKLHREAVMVSEWGMQRLRIVRIAIVFGMAGLVACAPSRPPVPPGQVPHQEVLLSADEEYGQEVLGGLTEQFPLSRDDGQIERVRSIVERLTDAGGAGHNPWHVHVLIDDKFKNAAATRGNFIFVWTGLLHAAQSEGELATVLSHEIAHVLAGHTAPDPQEEIAQIISGVSGEVAGQVAGYYGYYGLAAELAKILMGELVKAVAVNPAQQEREFEADQIGIFLMADARYNPEEAVAFWKKIQNDPAFESGVPGFLSSHPGIDERAAALEKMLPEAMIRYQMAQTGDSFRFGTSPLPREAPSATPQSDLPRSFWTPREEWVVIDDRVLIFPDPHSKAASAELTAGTIVTVIGRSGTWLRIETPQRGFVQGAGLAPVR